MTPLSPREREGPAAQRWEGEGAGELHTQGNGCVGLLANAHVRRAIEPIGRTSTGHSILDYCEIFATKIAVLFIPRWGERHELSSIQHQGQLTIIMVWHPFVLPDDLASEVRHILALEDIACCECFCRKIENVFERKLAEATNFAARVFSAE